jgi:hypothetical protein
MRTDLVFEVRRAQIGSLESWLSRAAVVAEVSSADVVVRARANRLFRPEDLVALVREWTQAYGVDAVLATYEGVLYLLGQSARPLATPPSTPIKRSSR